MFTTAGNPRNKCLDAIARWGLPSRRVFLQSGLCAVGNGISRLSRSLMKRTTALIFGVVGLVIGMSGRFSLNAEEGECAEKRNARYDQLKHQIDDYYTVDSPWKRADDVELESTLIHLMGAEVRIWQLTLT